jgi:hypothetical protein
MISGLPRNPQVDSACMAVKATVLLPQENTLDLATMQEKWWPELRHH